MRKLRIQKVQWPLWIWEKLKRLFVDPWDSWEESKTWWKHLMAGKLLLIGGRGEIWVWDGSARVGHRSRRCWCWEELCTWWSVLQRSVVCFGWGCNISSMVGVLQETFSAKMHALNNKGIIVVVQMIFWMWKMWWRAKFWLCQRHVFPVFCQTSKNWGDVFAFTYVIGGSFLRFTKSIA